MSGYFSDAAFYIKNPHSFHFIFKFSPHSLVTLITDKFGKWSLRYPEPVSGLLWIPFLTRVTSTCFFAKPSNFKPVPDWKSARNRLFLTDFLFQFQIRELFMLAVSTNKVHLVQIPPCCPDFVHDSGLE